MARAQPLLDRGLTVAQAADELNMTKGALSGVIFKVKSKKPKPPAASNDDNSWDKRLFEPWEDRKARRALEKQNVRPSLENERRQTDADRRHGG